MLLTLVTELALDGTRDKALLPGVNVLAEGFSLNSLALGLSLDVAGLDIEGVDGAEEPCKARLCLR